MLIQFLFHFINEKYFQVTIKLLKYKRTFTTKTQQCFIISDSLLFFHKMNNFMKQHILFIFKNPTFKVYL